MAAFGVISCLTHRATLGTGCPVAVCQACCCHENHHVESCSCLRHAGTAAILAVGGSKPTVTVDDNGRFGVQKVMKVNLTCDHRIVYGAGAAEFMVELKSVIENPEQLTF